MKRMCVPIFLFLCFAVAFHAYAQETETITLSTYYPAPYGVYNRLITNTLGVGDQDGAGLGNDDAPPSTSPGDVWIAGTVGIGTTAPTTKLQVSDSLTATASLQAGANEWLGFKAQQGDQMIYWDADKSLRFGTTTANDATSGWSEKMRILPSGNVGINTSSPDEELHVVGNIKMVDGNQGINKVLTADANGVGTWQDPPSGGGVEDLCYCVQVRCGTRAAGGSPAYETPERCADFGDWTAYAEADAGIYNSCCASTSRGASIRFRMFQGPCP